MLIIFSENEQSQKQPMETQIATGFRANDLVRWIWTTRYCGKVLHSQEVNWEMLSDGELVEKIPEPWGPRCRLVHDSENGYLKMAN